MAVRIVTRLRDSRLSNRSPFSQNYRRYFSLCSAKTGTAAEKITYSMSTEKHSPWYKMTIAQS